MCTIRKGLLIKSDIQKLEGDKPEGSVHRSIDKKKKKNLKKANQLNLKGFSSWALQQNMVNGSYHLSG